MTNVGEGNLDSGVNDVDAKPHITDGVVADSPSSIQKPLQDPQAQSVPKTQGLEASPAISDCRSLSESSSLTASPEMERNRILQELMETERKYVRDLETMQDYAIDLGIEEILDQDTIHGLFPNLDNIVKFQTEFLAVLESIYAQPWEEQCWGMAFIHKVGDEFRFHLAMKQAANLRLTLPDLTLGYCLSHVLTEAPICGHFLNRKRVFECMSRTVLITTMRWKYEAWLLSP